MTSFESRGEQFDVEDMSMRDEQGDVGMQSSMLSAITSSLSDSLAILNSLPLTNSIPPTLHSSNSSASLSSMNSIDSSNVPLSVHSLSITQLIKLNALLANSHPSLSELTPAPLSPRTDSASSLSSPYSIPSPPLQLAQSPSCPPVNFPHVLPPSSLPRSFPNSCQSPFSLNGSHQLSAQPIRPPPPRRLPSPHAALAYLESISAAKGSLSAARRSALSYIHHPAHSTPVPSWPPLPPAHSTPPISDSIDRSSSADPTAMYIASERPIGSMTAKYPGGGNGANEEGLYGYAGIKVEGQASDPSGSGLGALEGITGSGINAASEPVPCSSLSRQGHADQIPPSYMFGLDHGPQGSVHPLHLNACGGTGHDLVPLAHQTVAHDALDSAMPASYRSNHIQETHNGVPTTHVVLHPGPSDPGRRSASWADHHTHKPNSSHSGAHLTKAVSPQDTTTHTADIPASPVSSADSRPPSPASSDASWGPPTRHRRPNPAGASVVSQGRKGKKPPRQGDPVCANCGTGDTPLWRRDGEAALVCNACGLYSKTHGAPRPLDRPHATRKPDHGGNSAPTSCENCGTGVTPLWRRDEEGRILCNACGLYAKLHNAPRPVSMKTDVIRKRQRTDAGSVVVVPRNESGEGDAVRGGRKKPRIEQGQESREAPPGGEFPAGTLFETYPGTGVTYVRVPPGSVYDAGAIKGIPGVKVVQEGGDEDSDGEGEGAGMGMGGCMALEEYGGLGELGVMEEY